MDQPGKVASPLVVSCTGKMNISLSPFAPEIWSRETGSAVPSRVSSILRLNLVLIHGFLTISATVSIHLFKSSNAIGSVPSLSGHVIAYRWRSLPIVGRHRASE